MDVRRCLAGNDGVDDLGDAAVRRRHVDVCAVEAGSRPDHLLDVQRHLVGAGDRARPPGHADGGEGNLGSDAALEYADVGRVVVRELDSATASPEPSAPAARGRRGCMRWRDRGHWAGSRRGPSGIVAPQCTANRGPPPAGPRSAAGGTGTCPAPGRRPRAARSPRAPTPVRLVPGTSGRWAPVDPERHAERGLGCSGAADVRRGQPVNARRPQALGPHRPVDQRQLSGGRVEQRRRCARATAGGGRPISPPVAGAGRVPGSQQQRHAGEGARAGTEAMRAAPARAGGMVPATIDRGVAACASAPPIVPSMAATDAINSARTVPARYRVTRLSPVTPRTRPCARTSAAAAAGAPQTAASSGSRARRRSHREQLGRPGGIPVGAA